MGIVQDSFKRLHYPPEIILLCVRWYLSYSLSLRNIEEMMAERGIFVDHSTLHRWILHLTPLIERKNIFHYHLRGIRMDFDLESVKQELYKSREESSERDLLKLLKNNSFLFSDLYTRHFCIQPIFSEISFGDTFRCDFCWLNDNSDGPEWVLVEIEKPNIKLFTKKNEPSSELNHGIEQIKSWQRYFDKNPSEMHRIFGAVNKFRYILIIGENDDWNDIDASSWRSYENKTSNIEIRSMNIFDRAIELYEKIPDHYSSFRDNPIALNSNNLRDYLKKSNYINSWKQRLL